MEVLPLKIGQRFLRLFPDTAVEVVSQRLATPLRRQRPAPLARLFPPANLTILMCQHFD